MMDFCFLFHVYQEIELAKKLVESLRKFYPNKQIICIFDGLKNEGLKSYLVSQNVTVVESDRLLPQINGAAWIIKELETFLKLSKAPAYIHIDPDTQVLRSFENYPDPNVDLAGTVIDYTDGIRTADGACRWVTRNAAAKLFTSNILNDERYRLFRSFGYQRFKKPFLQDGEIEEDTWVLDENRVIGNAANILKLKIEDWTEISCNVSSTLDNGNNIAVFHPLKYSQVKIEAPYQSKTAPTLDDVKAKILQEIVDYAAKLQAKLVADYPEQEQKTWQGDEGKVAEARAILSQGMSAAKHIQVEAIAASRASSPEQIEAATLNLAQIIVNKNEEWRNRIGQIAGIRARKYAEIQGLTNIADVQNYPVNLGWGIN